MPLIDFDGCHACTLKKEWDYLRHPKMAYTPPIEEDDLRALMLGEAPGDNEDIQGKPFVGVTGQYLRDRIPSKWKRSVYWQNVVRCQPPKNRTPTPQEMTCCSTYLEEDLEKIKPHAILGIGSIALEYFWPDFNKGIGKARGIPLPVAIPGGTAWFMPTFHPSYAVRADRKEKNGDVKNVIEPVFRNDIMRFFSLLETDFKTPPQIWTPPPKESFFYPKSLDEAWNLFCRLKDPYATDFETFKVKPYLRDAKPLTASFSDGEITFGIPICWPGDINPWGLEFLKRVASTRRPWICQSAGMEYLWLRYLTGELFPEFHDTEVLARLLHDRKGLGALEHTSKIYLGVNVKALSPPLDKNRMNEYPLDQVLPYNCYDSLATKLVFNIMIEKLCNREGPFIENYERTMNTIRSVVEMEIRGLDIDFNQSEEMQKRLYDQQQELQRQTRQLPEVKEYEQKESTIFSVSAPQNVATVLTRYYGINLPKTNEDSQYYSTDEDDLTPLIGQCPLVDLTLDYREVAKQLSTYVMPILNGQIIGVDGKLHPAYKTVHTFTYRLSSELPNIQNWPKRKNREIRRQIIPPPGYLFVACDYGGLEARVIQMASQDLNLLNDLVDPAKYLNDTDLHWYWLHKILQYYPKYMDRLASVSGQTQEKQILKAGRTIIKTDFVFASFYGSVSESVAARTQVPVEIIKAVHHEFWGRYTNVKKWVDGQFQQYKNHGFVSSLSGRIRADVLPGNEVTNTPVQGTGAEIVLEAQTALYYRGINEDIHYLPRINIHDDLTFMIPNNNDTDRYINVIMDDMVVPRFPFVTCPLLVECSVGDKNWCDMEEIAKWIGGTWNNHTIGHAA